MKYTLIIAFTAISIFSFGQKRIGADINTHLTNLNYTIHFHEVVKGPFLYSAGIFFGGYGIGGNRNNSSQLASTIGIGPAYPSLTTFITDTSGTHHLIDYRVKGKGFGVYGGIGLFHEFGPQQGIRFNLNNRIGWMKSEVSAQYYQEGHHRSFTRQETYYHPSGAVSLELYHTMRLTGRSTFYWGFKIPYYYSLDKGRYNPQRDTELYHKFKMDLSIGMTYAVGKCD